MINWLIHQFSNTQQKNSKIAKIVFDENKTLNFLIVDDASINRYIIKEFLNKSFSNFNSDECSDGLQVLEKIYNNTYDIIFLDIKMPKLNGDEVAKIIKKRKYKTIIVGITGQSEIKEKVLKNGIDLCLIKPLDLQSFRLFLKSLIDEKYFK